MNSELGYYSQRLSDDLSPKYESCLELLFQIEKLQFDRGIYLRNIDGTDRKINRPQDKEQRKKYYSGKRKAHAVKNNVIAERRGKVKYLSQTYEGKKHDKAIADEENYPFPAGSRLWQDTGFQGFAPRGVIVLQPKKKPRNQELSEAEKRLNRLISKQRVVIEHHISGIKRSQIVMQTFRNRKENYVDAVMETACGLHNFRLVHRSKFA
jgi:hypothetical protein